IGRTPSRTDPAMVRIFAHSQISRTAGKKIQVVNVVSWAGDDSMIPAVHQNDIAVTGPNCLSPGVVIRIQVLKCKALRPGSPEIVNLVLVHFLWRIVLVMLMRWVAGPISARSINLNYDQLVSGKGGGQNIHDLARNVSSPAQTGDHVVWRDQTWGQTGL